LNNALVANFKAAIENLSFVIAGSAASGGILAMLHPYF
jgi:hypothetical protein